MSLLWYLSAPSSDVSSPGPASGRSSQARGKLTIKTYPSREISYHLDEWAFSRNFFGRCQGDLIWDVETSVTRFGIFLNGLFSIWNFFKPITYAIGLIFILGLLPPAKCTRNYLFQNQPIYLPNYIPIELSQTRGRYRSCKFQTLKK